MSIRHLSVSLDNVPGKLQELCQLVGAEMINIRAISITSTVEQSTLGMVVDDLPKASRVLKDHGYSVEENEVIAVEVPDHPGGLQAILKPLKTSNINVLFLYSHLGKAKDGNTVFILAVDKTEEAMKVLSENWIHILGAEVYSI